MSDVAFSNTEACERVASEMAAAVKNAVTPSAVGAVFLQTPSTSFLWSGATGYLFEDVTRRKLEGAAATVDTVYDLASLTKVLSTTLIAADAVLNGTLDLDATPFEIWPDVTVAQVLAHEGGLKAHRDYFRPIGERGDAGRLSARREILEAVLDTKPIAAPSTTTVYSDLGFIALGAYLEHHLGAPLDTLFDRVCRRHITSPVPSPSLRYVSLTENGVHPGGSTVAPTEKCPWRGRVMQGQVHDDNAFVMGGVAGHAGLFGSVFDVVAAGRALLRGATDVSTSLGEILPRFLAGTGSDHDGARPLGFDRATPDGTTGGALSPHAFGHLGFTGTSLWVDPMAPVGEGDAGCGAVYVLLTNRVHPTREREGIRDLRISFHRAARALVDSAR